MILTCSAIPGSGASDSKQLGEISQLITRLEMNYLEQMHFQWYEAKCQSVNKVCVEKEIVRFGWKVA